MIGGAAVRGDRFGVVVVRVIHLILIGVVDGQIEIVARGKGQFGCKTFVAAEGHPEVIVGVRTGDQLTGTRHGVAENKVRNAGWGGQVVGKIA